MLCCSITSRVKGYPFEVALGGSQDLAGVVLADQVKILDWKARQASKKEKAASQVMAETLSEPKPPHQGLVLLSTAPF